MNKKVLIVVFTPLQYLNARLFIKNNACHPDSVIMILASDKENITGIETILKGKYMFPFRYFKNMPFKLTVILKAFYFKMFTALRTFDAVVLGNLDNYFAFYLGHRYSKKQKKVYLIDDGFATVVIFRRRNEEKDFTIKSRSGAFHKSVMSVLGVKNTTVIPKLHIYTLFAINDKNAIDTVSNILQGENYINEALGRPVKPVCFFIGGPTIEEGLMPLNDFTAIIERIKEIYARQGVKLVYILHRFEEKKPLSIDQLRFEKPLEVVFQKELAYLPSEVSSFYSTALFNLSRLYPQLNYSYYDIGERIEVPKRKKTIKTIYEYLSKDHVIKKLDNSLPKHSK